MVEYRGLEARDEAAFGSLIAAVTAADGIPAFSEYKAVDIGHRGGYTLLAESEGELVAAAHAAWHHGDRVARPHWAIEVAVHPASRQTGIWAEMVRRTAADIPHDEHHVVWGWNAGFELIARDLGYAPARRLSVMERPLPADRAPALPAGIELAPFRAGRDEAAWLECNNAAFMGHPENGGLTTADLAERLALPWFRAEDLLMAWRGEELAGSCWTKRHADAVGEIYVIGVHPRYQGRGLGKELVLAGLQHLATAAAARTGMLYVDHDSVGAMQLYLELGFEQVWVTTMYAPGTGVGRLG